MTFRLGLVGLCTSHPLKWTPLIRELAVEGRIDVEISGVWDDGEIRSLGYAEEFGRQFGIPGVFDSLDEMAAEVDGAIIHAANWDRRVDLAAVFVDAEKPVLLDKPIVGTRVDVDTMLGWIAEGARLCGGSSLRHAPEIQSLLAVPEEDRGRPHTALVGCGTDVFFYGIHAYSLLCGIMGPGLESVRHLADAGERLIECVWDDGRVGIISLAGPGKLPFHATVVTPKTLSQFTVDPAGIYRAALELWLPYLSGSVVRPPVTAMGLFEPELAALAAAFSRQEGGSEVGLSEIPDDFHPYDGAAFVEAYRKKA